ncbi:MAG: hypothetical protein PVH31_11050 [Ectothiorhodospiraceae bacterium]|jgi:hypothetical protein
MSPASAQARQRRQLRRGAAGVCLFGVIVGGALQAFWSGFPPMATGAAAWAAGVLLWPDLASRSRRQALVLLAVGVGGLALGWSRGMPPLWPQVFAGNAALIAMLAAVSFLRLITAPAEGEDHTPPAGRRAMRSTILGLHLFGAVVNLSTIFIMARRMAPHGHLDSRQVRLLTRGFSSAAFWSPFFAAMAAALTYAPGAKLGALVAVGLPLAVVALGVTLTELERSRERPDTFQGYPMNPRSLWLPALLGLIILVLHGIRPSLSVLGIIAALAPGITAVTLALRREPVLERVGAQITRGLPLMAGELSLFLAAAVMAGGLESVFATTGEWLPFTTFAGPQAAMVLAMLVALALVGVHPLIGIAAASSLLAPVVPDSNLLAMTFLCAWAIGVSVSPLSGLNLAMQGAYGLRGLDILRWNLPYGAVMLVTAMIALNVYAWIAGI